MIKSDELNNNAAWFELERVLLKKIATGASADAVLDLLCGGLERLMQDGERCAVHLVDTDGMRIARMVAPSLGEFFRWRGPVWVGPAEGTSAAAAYLRCEITTDHLDESLAVVDPELQAAVRKYGIGSMHATPVLSTAGEVLAVFSVYYREPMARAGQHAGLIEWAVQIAKTVLSQERMVSNARRAETSYHALIEGLHDALFITQEDIIVYVNPAMMATTGRTESELLNSHFHGFIDHHDAAMLLELKARRGRGERVPADCKLRLLHPSGELRVMRYGESLVTWNNAPAVLATLSDITDRERAEQEVRRLNGELERRVTERTRELAEANRDLEAFSYTVSHDLRAPLRAIDGFCAVLMEDHGAALNPEARRQLERVHNAARHMNRMIEGMLTLAHAGKTEPHLVPVDLSAMAHEAIAQLRAVAPERIVECVIPAGIQAMGDPSLLRSVLDNLLGNAWKFTGKREGARIEFGAMVNKGEQVCFVRDNGAGFDGAHAKKLFGVFQRLHHGREFEGMGIGLATAQRIIARHGGRIWAESEAGKGATFYFSLPVANGMSGVSRRARMGGRGVEEALVASSGPQAHGALAGTGGAPDRVFSARIA